MNVCKANRVAVVQEVKVSYMGYPGLDITYAQSRDSEFINWLYFLKKSEISALEWVAARDLSVRWQTTAVADVSVYLPRYYNRSGAKGMPSSGELQRLNKEFSQAVWNKDLKLARLLYNHIIKRGLELTMDFINNEKTRESLTAAS